MNSLWLVAARNLTRRPGQTVLGSSVLILAVLLFFSGVGLLREVQGPFEEMFRRLKGAHYTLNFDTRVHDVAQLREWWQQRSEVRCVGPALPTVLVSENAYLKERRISKPLLVTERPTELADLDHLLAVDGSVEQPPGPGEVWIPTSISREIDAAVGDQLELPTASGLVPFTVTAIVVDPQYSAPFNSPTRVWIAAGELPQHFPLASLNQVILGIRLAENADTPELRSAFFDSVGGHFNGDFMDYQRVSVGYTAPYHLMAMMLVVFSGLSILVALLAVHGNVTSSILADLKVIGLLRTQGFRPLDIRRTYQLQYLLMAAPAVLVGILLGTLAVRQGVALLMQPTGMVADHSRLLPLAACVFPASVTLIYLFVGRVARRADRIRPVDAIRFNAESIRRHVRSHHEGQWTGVQRLARLPVSLIIALRMFVVQRRRAAFTMASVVFATLAAAFATNLDFSFERSRADLGLLGFDSADVRLSRGGRRLSIRHAPFMQAMNAREDVVAVSTWDYLEGSLVRGPDQANLKLVGNVLDGDPDRLGLRNLAGRNPRTADEISIGATTASREQIELGEQVEFLFYGRRLQFEVTGIYQTLNNGGSGFRVPAEAVRQANPLFEPTQYGLVLADAHDAEAFIQSIEREYGEAVDGQPGDLFIGALLDGIIRAMRVSNGFLSAILLAAACVFIFNSTLMSVAENRKTYGILLAVGATPGQLRSSVAWNLVIQATCGIALGVVGWWIVGGTGLSLLFANLGLVSFPLQNSLVRTLIVVSIIFALCVASGWLSARRELRIEPKGLIVE